jgi:hypothetical protein
MAANSDFHTFVFFIIGITLFLVKIGGTKDPQKQLFLSTILFIFGIQILMLGIINLSEFDFVINSQTFIFYGFLIEAIIAFILSVERK